MKPIDCRGMTLAACLRVQTNLFNACPAPKRDYSVAPDFVYVYVRPWSSLINRKTYGVEPWNRSVSKLS